MRRAARIDVNQTEIVEKLRKIGATVHSAAQLGNGFPDLVVGIFGRNFLFEIKAKGKRKQLKPGQVDFHNTWKGSAHIVESFDECLKIINDSGKQLPF